MDYGCETNRKLKYIVLNVIFVFSLIGCGNHTSSSNASVNNDSRYILKDIVFSRTFCTTDIVISQPSGPGGSLDVSGAMESRQVTCLGARNKFKGRVEIEGNGFENYIFEGDNDHPLEFSCLPNGYMRTGGKGRVLRKVDNSLIFEIK